MIASVWFAGVYHETAAPAWSTLKVEMLYVYTRDS